VFYREKIRIEGGMKMPSKVYFTDMRAKHGLNLLDKLGKLYDAAGFQEFIKPKELVALKVHFGERGNTSYIRPQFLRKIVDKVKAAGGKPFLTDANTLYVGSRANAVDHLITAIENGFPYSVVNAPLIIADGLNGKDYRTVEVNLKHFKEVKIGSAICHADSFIAVSHFKGHEATGFGGTLKNVGMGSGCRSGKQQMHSDLLPRIKDGKCLACGRCIKWCPGEAISVAEQAIIEYEKCIGCGECTVTCPHGAIGINWKTQQDVIQEKIVEYAYGVLKDKKDKAGFITFVMGVTPDCDCVSYSDAPIIGDVGILASRDPVALDQACIDLVNQQAGLKNSRLGEENQAEDKFGTLYPDVDWRVQLAYGEEIGLGTRDYELVKI
jgi:hypothetical protein